MTFEIVLLLVLLATMVVLFLTEALPVDLTAFLGLAFLVVAGYLRPEEAFTGVSSPAVTTLPTVFLSLGSPAKG